jgi:hypothetical protein
MQLHIAGHSRVDWTEFVEEKRGVETGCYSVEEKRGGEAGCYPWVQMKYEPWWKPKKEMSNNKQICKQAEKHG